MPSILDPSSLAFFALGLAFLIRIPTAIRVPSSRLTWLSTGIGALALFCCGTLIPLPVIDAWMGGSNFVSLVQNVLAAAAFWLIMQAVVTKGLVPLRQVTMWPLVVSVAVIVVSFFFIDRGATAKDFMFERADQVPTFIYSAVYLIFIGGTCAYLFAKLWTNRSRSFTLIFVGSALLVVGTSMQLLGLGAICFSWGSEPVNVMSYQIGLVGYTAGMVFIALNMVGMAFMKARSSRRLARTNDAIQSVMRNQGVPVPERAVMLHRSSADNLHALYENVIAVNDHVQAKGDTLSDADWDKVSNASTLVSERMFTRPQLRPVRYLQPQGSVLRWAARDVKSKTKV